MTDETDDMPDWKKPENVERNRRWTERSLELRTDPHLIAQCERLMGPLALIRGTKDVRSLKEVVGEVAQLVALLETHPDLDQTANVGGIIVTRGPMDGYGIMVHAADIYRMHLESFWTDRGMTKPKEA